MIEQTGTKIILTAAIKEKMSGKVVLYEDVESFQSPFETALTTFEGYLNTIFNEVSRGEERDYDIFFKREGGRPMCMDGRLINRGQSWEKTYTGDPEPFSKGSFPFQFENGVPFYAKKGAFPAPFGPDPLSLGDDGGMDEESILAELRNVDRTINAALRDEFSSTSQIAIICALTALMKATGASGLMPREDCLLDDSAEGLAMIMYDSALCLLLQSGYACSSEPALMTNHLERLKSDPDHNQEVNRLVSTYRNEGVTA